MLKSGRTTKYPTHYVLRPTYICCTSLINILGCCKAIQEIKSLIMQIDKWSKPMSTILKSNALN